MGEANSLLGADSWFRRASSPDSRRPLGSQGYSYDGQSDRLAVAAAHLRTMFDFDRDTLLFVTKSWPKEEGPPGYRAFPVRPVTADVLRHFDVLNQSGSDIYVAVNPVRPVVSPQSGRPEWGRTRAHIAEPRRLQLDIDHHASDAIPALAADVLSGIVPAPDVIVRSSPSKYQCLWNLPEQARSPKGDPRQWTAPLAEYYSYLIGRRYGGDGTVYPVSQVMRVPGFYNRKPAYREDPPLVRPCAQPRRQWYRQSAPRILAPTDFETLQSVVRPEDLQQALKQFATVRASSSDLDAVRERQSLYREEIAFSRALQCRDGSRRGMDVQMILAGGVEASYRIVERQEQDAARRLQKLSAPVPVKRVSRDSPPPTVPPKSPPPKSPEDPDTIVDSFRAQRDRARASVRHGAGAPPSTEVWVVGRDGLPELRRVRPSTKEFGYGVGLHARTLVKTPSKPPVVNPGFADRASDQPSLPPSNADFRDWGVTMRWLEEGYAPDAVAFALVQRRSFGPDQKQDPYRYAAVTVNNAVEACRSHAEEAGVSWQPGDRTFDDTPDPGTPTPDMIASQASDSFVPLDGRALRRLAGGDTLPTPYPAPAPAAGAAQAAAPARESRPSRPV